MRISLFIFLLGIIFIITGYTHQVTPSCDKETKLKLVDKEEFDKINGISGINASHFGSPLN